VDLAGIDGEAGIVADVAAVDRRAHVVASAKSAVARLETMT
jgi:hypothetical protein